MMKTSVNDPFDVNICLRGLGNMISFVLDDVYEYAYVLTFKRSMRMYKKEFHDPDEVPVLDLAFFYTTGDLYVTNCAEANFKLADYKLKLIDILNIDEVHDFHDEVLDNESYRYKPYYLMYKKSKSYKKLKQYYERLLVETIKCLFTYACVLTAQRYRVPPILRKQFNLADDQCFRLLNSDDLHVQLLIELIIDLKKSLAELREITEKQLAKTISRRRKPKVEEPK
ncbi:hypothetical protein ACSBL2_09930 [Pedobacter sp. AW31-3R]|uniref:hypothetical protein n=1 Tax=Pedobacter sp. AW31-3R TaxID=3445781 RepID=UPI003FA01B44